MTWAQCLKRVFRIDIGTCRHRGAVKVIACIEGPAVVKRMLGHRAHGPNPPEHRRIPLALRRWRPCRIDPEFHIAAKKRWPPSHRAAALLPNSDDSPNPSALAPEKRRHRQPWIQNSTLMAPVEIKRMARIVARERVSRQRHSG